MKIAQAILWGGLVAGVLDIGYAIVVYGLSYNLPPMRILQSVDAGWIGRTASRAGEWNTALAGLATHFLLATIMAAVFVLLTTRFTALTRRPIPWGVIYGLVLYVAMNWIIVPLSAAHASEHFAGSFDEAMARLNVSFGAARMAQRAQDPLQLAGTIWTHTGFVGVPIALIARHFSAKT